MVPGLAMGALVMMPFIDRGRMEGSGSGPGRSPWWRSRRLRGRVDGERGCEHAGPDRGREIDEPQAWQLIPASQLAGIGAFHAGHCAGCHRWAEPDRAGSTQCRYCEASEWLMDHFQKPGDGAEAADLSSTQMHALVELVTKRDDNGVEAWKAASMIPENILHGAEVYQANMCSQCHALNGEGGNAGPVLNGVRTRHERAWVLATSAIRNSTRRNPVCRPSTTCQCRTSATSPIT